jgi:hypothetical protein
MIYLKASPLGYIKCLGNGKKKVTIKKTLEIAPHRCAYKVKTIMAATKITHFTFISVVNQGILLL